MKSVWKHITALHEYIIDHLDDPLTTDNLAAKFNTNSSTLRKQFLKQYRVPLHSFIQQKRMEKAMQLLKDGYYTIAEVGTAVGYHEPSYFTQAFISYYGTSPKQVSSGNK